MREGWKHGTLGDIVEESKSEAVLLAHEYELLTVRLHAKGIVASGKSPNKTAGGRKHYVRLPGEILVGRQNYHKRCVGRVPESLVGFVTSNAISAFSPRPGIDANFALVAMQSPEATEAAESFMSGTGQKEISAKNIALVPFNIPPLEEQQRIVDLVGSLDEAIEAADGAAVMSQAALGELIETLSQDVTAPLGSLATMRSGPSWGSADESDVSQPGFDPVLAITNTRPTGDIDLSAQRFVKGLSAKVMRLTDDSIVMIRTNGNRSRIGNVYRSIPSVVGFAVSAFQIAIEPLAQSNADFLFWVLSAPKMQAQISNSASGSTGLGNVAIGWLKKLEVSFPEDELIRGEFVSLCQAANDNLLATASYATSLRTLRSELLTVLLSGEHEIPESYDAFLTPASQLEPAEGHYQIQGDH